MGFCGARKILVISVTLTEVHKYLAQNMLSVRGCLGKEFHNFIVCHYFTFMKRQNTILPVHNSSRKNTSLCVHAVDTKTEGIYREINVYPIIEDIQSYRLSNIYHIKEKEWQYT